MLLRNALWTIERNLNADLSVSIVAAACGVSPFHLAHAFTSGAGLPLMQYVRARRLSMAARAVAEGQEGLLPIALEVGYASHEAFTRAFKAQFGMTPEAVRLRGLAAEALPLTKPLVIPERRTMDLKSPRIEQGDPVLAIGLSQRHALGNPERIPAQWGLFMETYYGTIPDRLPGIPIAVNRNMDDDGFDYVCAAPVSRIDRCPEGLVPVRIPAQTYAVFTHRGHVSALGQTYAAIWNVWFPANPWRPVNTAGMEKHLDGFDPRTGLGGVELWIPVEPA